MKLDPDQLEWIVREVVRRLQSGLPSPRGDGRSEGARRTDPPHIPDAHITLTQPLITAATLEHKLDGVTRLTVLSKAVVTPAARDLLRERGIELNRSA